MTFCSTPSENSIDVGQQLSQSSKYTKLPHFKFPSRAVHLGNLLLENNISHIDLLSIDIEGMEISVLDTIDFDLVNIRYILVESFSPDDLFAFMSKIGFTLIKRVSIRDYLFYNLTTQP